MAGKTITQRIAFEGGKEMEVQLKQLGDAGTTAFKRLKEAGDQANGIGSKLLPAIAAIRERLDALADSSAEVGKKFNELSGKTLETGRHIGELVIGVAAATTGFVALIKGAADTATQIEDMATTLGLTTEQFQTLAFAAATFGVSQEQLVQGLGRLGRQIDATNKQNIQYRLTIEDLQKELLTHKITSQQYNDEIIKLNRSAALQTNIFTRLGISVRESNGETANTETVLFRLADAFKNTTNATDKLAISTEFAKIGQANFIPFLNQGSEAIKNLQKEALRVAPPLSEIQKLVGAEFVAAFNNFSSAASSAFTALRLVFAPDLTRLMRAAIEVIVNARSQVITFAGELASKLKPVIEDIIAVLQGKEIDKNSFVARAIEDIEAFYTATRTVVSGLIATWGVFVKAMDVVAEGLNGIFGTHVTGLELAFGVALAALTGIFGTFVAAVSLAVSIVGGLVAVFGGVELALVALGAAIGVWIGTQLVDPFNAAVDAVKGFFQGMVDYIGGIFDGLMGFIDRVLDAARSALNFVKQLAGGSGGGDGSSGQAFAGGGAVRGPGTDRSDSIMAWLSNGEFVHRTAAVRHYGIDFMNAVNNLRFPKPAFALGGLVRAMDSVRPKSNHFADGGLADLASLGGASTGRPFVLNIGGEVFSGLTAEDQTFDKLQRFAVRRHVQSAGRKPSWVT